VKTIDWNEVRRISQWYTWKHLKDYSYVLGGADIVAEAMLCLVKTDAAKWDEMSLTTIVCNNTRWAALKLFDQHKKHFRIDGSMGFSRESYYVDFDEQVFADDFRTIFESAKDRVITAMRKSLGTAPVKLNAKERWEYIHRHTIRRIQRYESGFIEHRVIHGETLDVLAHKFKITKERARQIDCKFWSVIRNEIVHMYDMPLEHIGDLLIAGERIKNDDDETTNLLKE